MLESLLSVLNAQVGGGDDSDLPFPPSTPFKGVAHSSDFVYGDVLAAKMGLTAGIAFNSESGWLHFIEDNGLELYIAKKPLRYNVCWEDLNALGLSSGGAETTIGGEIYIVRLMTGAISATGGIGAANSGGEWNRYMYNVYDSLDRAGFPPNAEYWGDYTGPMLGVATFDGSTELGVGTICSAGHITRGSDSGGGTPYAQVTGMWYVDPNSPQLWYSWRPILVKKSTIPPTPYRGEVLASNFITGSALAAAVGLTTATLINDNTPWLKFVDAGKTFYMPKLITHNALSWSQLNALNLIYGGTTITFGGHTYKVRLMTGGDGNNPTGTRGGDYDNYFLRVTTEYQGEAWASNSPTDMGWLGGTSSGELIICQEASTSGGTLLRGYPGFAGVWYEPDDTPYPGYGWRPVLELVS
jgi:hypothetical protein